MLGLKSKAAYKVEQDERRNMGKGAYGLKSGTQWNPALKFPRNELCPCGSGKKFKKCHLDKVPLAIKER